MGRPEDSILSNGVTVNIKFGCGIDIAARTFTAAMCELDETPSKALNFTQIPEDFVRLEKHLLASGLLPSNILVVMEATDNYWHP